MKCTRIVSCLAATALVVATGSAANAAIIMSTAFYTENFDGASLGGTTAGVWSGTTKAAVPGLSGWEGVRAGGSGSSMNFTADNGAGNSGALYSHGGTGSTERALGSVASGTNIPAFGVELTNGLNGAITAVAIDYRGEFWRSSTAVQNVLKFEYLVGAPGQANYLTAAATGVVALDLVGPTPVTTNGAIDGNVNGANFSSSFAVNVPVGQSLYIRWTDVNDGGSDAGLAVDAFNLQATVPEPSTIGLALSGAIGLLGLRRRS